MKKFVGGLFSLLSLWLGITAATILPVLWMVATNTTKAPGNNPEGEMFQAPGWIMMVLLAGGIVAAEIVMVKKSAPIWRFVIPAAFAAGGVIGWLVFW
ncbi:MAG: hypothetical protein ACOYJY_06100 [Acutalibacteraceae bacterium]